MTEEAPITVWTIRIYYVCPLPGAAVEAGWRTTHTLVGDLSRERLVAFLQAQAKQIPYQLFRDQLESVINLVAAFPEERFDPEGGPQGSYDAGRWEGNVGTVNPPAKLKLQSSPMIYLDAVQGWLAIPQLIDPGF